MGIGLLDWSADLERPHRRRGRGAGGMVPTVRGEEEPNPHMGEATAALGAIHTSTLLFNGREVFHFINNQDVLASYVKGAASTVDLAAASCLYNIVVAQINACILLELVEAIVKIAVRSANLI